MSTITAYQSLLLDFPPRPIRNDRQYRRTMRRIGLLMDKEKLSRAEGELLELLGCNIQINIVHASTILSSGAVPKCMFVARVHVPRDHMIGKRKGVQILPHFLQLKTVSAAVTG